MSQAEHIEQETETAERPFLVRSYPADLTPGDGRTVDVRIVPYGERITHNDGYGGVPKGVPYTEEWVAGAFASQVKATGREKQVLMNFEHQEGLAGVIGHGLMLREEPDGFYGSFRIHETTDGDKALMLIKEGVLGGVSLEAVEKKSIRGRDGIIRRVKAHLHGVALTRRGAFSRSVVLALRNPPIFDEELLPLDIPEGTIERCRRLGLKLPQRYEAHPDETGTPAESGTPEDGTGQTLETSSEE